MQANHKQRGLYLMILLKIKAIKDNTALINDYDLSAAILILSKGESCLI